MIKMFNTEFLDFKPLVENKLFNWKMTRNENIIVKWNNIREISATYKDSHTIKIKYNC